MGRTDDAKRLLMQVIRANPSRTNDLLVAGELYMRTGDTQQGISLLQRAESQQPSAHAELMLAVAYLKLKQPERAKQMLDLAKKHAPGNSRDLSAAANYYREEHDYKAAITTLKSAPRQTPEVLADLGYTYELDGDKQEAAKAYTRAANATSQGNRLSAQRGPGATAEQQSGEGARVSDSRRGHQRRTTIACTPYAPCWRRREHGRPMRSTNTTRRSRRCPREVSPKASSIPSSCA